MSRKVLILSASPRKNGNSDMLCDRFMVGAQDAGMRGVLVRTGKYREEIVKRSAIRPSLIINSIAEIGEVIDAAHQIQWENKS